MRKILPVFGAVLLMTGTAMAAQPLTDNQMDAVTAGASGPNSGGGPGTVVALGNFLTFCPPGGCPPPPPPPNAPPSAQFSYILTINGIGLSTNGTGVPTNGISLQALLVRP